MYLSPEEQESDAYLAICHIELYERNDLYRFFLASWIVL